MENKIDNPPAFPTSFSGDYPAELVGGLTMRDYFAAKAMQGFCTNPHMTNWCSESIAGLAYQRADAMLKARSKPLE